jgi:LuxR family maltose regulon positive regulatory protein
MSWKTAEQHFMENRQGSPPLIETKLHRPPVDRNHIYRPHLAEKLDQHHRRPLILVSAPAGYGKTSLVSAWLQAGTHSSAWLALDEGDNDLRLFLNYFLAAVHSLFPGAVKNTQDMVNALALPAAPALASTLLNELDRIEGAFILVLDDFHLIHHESAIDLLAQLLRYPPQSMQLVLIGRRDPSLPISTLRAKSLVTEIRTLDLRFSQKETARCLTRVMDAPVASEVAAFLGQKTEGWVTGLRLVALSMRHGVNIDPSLFEPQVEAQYVMEYLFNEVFSRQPPEIQQYLLGTAILDRFCGPLGEVMCIPHVKTYTCGLSGWDFITWLNKKNLFLIPLDHEKRWFRYHYLFQKLLARQLKRQYSTEKINTLHGRASDWFADSGLIEEALQHRLAGTYQLSGDYLCGIYSLQKATKENLFCPMIPISPTIKCLPALFTGSLLI